MKELVCKRFKIYFSTFKSLHLWCVGLRVGEDVVKEWYSEVSNVSFADLESGQLVDIQNLLNVVTELLMSIIINALFCVMALNVVPFLKASFAGICPSWIFHQDIRYMI